MPQPATIISTISQEVLKILEKEGVMYVPSPFELTRAKKLTLKLKDINQALYHSLMGAIYSVERDENKSIFEHKEAIKITPSDTVILCNYASSLCRFKRFREAMDIMRSAYEVNKSDPEILKDLIFATYSADDIDELPILFSAYRALTLEPHDAEFWLEEDKEDEASLPALHKESKVGGVISLESLKNELGL